MSCTQAMALGLTSHVAYILNIIITLSTKVTLAGAFESHNRCKSENLG